MKVFSIKILVLILGILSISICTLASGGVKGGGGVTRKTINGVEYLTFGSPEVKLKMEELEDIPGLNLLKTTIGQLDLDWNIKGQLLKAVLPSPERRYYYVNRISPEESAKLLRIYKKLVVADPNDKVVLYGVTDPVSKETYLLPAFKDKLDTEAKQAHVLFHESTWLLSPLIPYPNYYANPDDGYIPRPYATYKQIVQAEKAFGNYLEMKIGGNDEYPIVLYKWLANIMKSPTILLLSALDYDIRKKNLQTTTSNHLIYSMICKNDEPCNSTFKQDPVVGEGFSLTKIFQFNESEKRAYAMSQSAQSPNTALYKVLSISTDFCIEWPAHIDGGATISHAPHSDVLIYDSEQKSFKTTPDWLESSHGGSWDANGDWQLSTSSNNCLLVYNE
jgi:hypothetical protein